MPHDPSGHRVFFEARYQSAQREARTIPWAHLEPNRFVVDRVSAIDPPNGRAAVVGCGLGDDAEFLASRGWTVTAFDVSPSAIEWCRERFPRSEVDYVVADLFELDPGWHRRYALVVEVATIQSLAPELRLTTIRAIADLVRTGGILVVAALGRLRGEYGPGPPWPVTRAELQLFEAHGLEELAFVSEPSPWDGVARFNATYARRDAPWDEDPSRLGGARVTRPTMP